MGISRKQARATLVATLFVVSLGFGIVIPIMPHLARQLGATPLQIGLITTSYAAVQFLVAPFWGRLSDRHGRRPILLVGLVGLVLSFGMMALARNYSSLLAGRILGGLLSAATIPTAQAMAADLSPPQERARAMGTVGASMGVGFIFGPVIGGSVAHLGVSMPFWTGAAVGFITLVLAYWVLQEPEREPVPARERGNRLDDLKRSLRSRSALFFGIMCVVVLGQSSILSMLALYLADRFDGTSVHAGLAFALQGISSVLIQAVGIAAIVGRLGEARTILLGLSVGLAGFTLLVLAPSLPVALVATPLAMSAFAFCRPCVGSLITRTGDFPHGTALGLLASFESLGRAVGPIWAGAIYPLSPRAPYISSAVLYLAVILLVAPRLRRWSAATGVAGADENTVRAGN